MYAFIDAEGRFARRSSDGATLAWDAVTGGPAGGGQAWRQWQADGAPPPAGFVPPDEVSAPADISDRQFAQGLAERGLISEDEAEMWVASGVLPLAFLNLVDALPAEQRFPARMLLRGATRFEFGHPLAEAFAGLADPPWTTEARAAFWRHCATL